MPTLLSSRLNTFRGASLGVGLMLCTPKQHAMSTTACHKKHLTEQLTITAKYCKDFWSAETNFLVHFLPSMPFSSLWSTPEWVLAAMAAACGACGACGCGAGRLSLLHSATVEATRDVINGPILASICWEQID